MSDKLIGGDIFTETGKITNLAPVQAIKLYCRFHEDFDTFRAKDRDVIYSQLKLEYTGTNRQWCLDFREHPNKEVIFTGDEPTTEEIIDVLLGMSFPIVMVKVFQIIIADAIARNK